MIRRRSPMRAGIERAARPLRLGGIGRKKRSVRHRGNIMKQICAALVITAGLWLVTGCNAQATSDGTTASLGERLQSLVFDFGRQALAAFLF